MLIPFRELLTGHAHLSALNFHPLEDLSFSSPKFYMHPPSLRDLKTFSSQPTVRGLQILFLYHVERFDSSLLELCYVG